MGTAGSRRRPNHGHERLPHSVSFISIESHLESASLLNHQFSRTCIPGRFNGRNACGHADVVPHEVDPVVIHIELDLDVRALPTESCPRIAGYALGVWAAEGFEKPRKFFDPSESLRLHYFNAGKGSDTPENVIF